MLSCEVIKSENMFKIVIVMSLLKRRLAVNCTLVHGVK